MKTKQLFDGVGITLKSGERFRFVCCDCALVHNAVLVSDDGNPIGLAVERNTRATKIRRTRKAKVAA